MTRLFRRSSLVKSVALGLALLFPGQAVAHCGALLLGGHSREHHAAAGAQASEFRTVPEPGPAAHFAGQLRPNGGTGHCALSVSLFARSSVKEPGVQPGAAGFHVAAVGLPDRFVSLAPTTRASSPAPCVPSVPLPPLRI